MLRRHLLASSTAISSRSFSKKAARRAAAVATPAAANSSEFKVTPAAVAAEAKEVFKMMFGTFTILLGSGLGIGYAVENYKRMHPPTPPGQLLEITVNGQRSVVHAQVRGGRQGTTSKGTVLLDGSLGETSFDWDKVIAALPEDTAVVAIDRPGLAFSTPSPLPRTSETISKEYQQVLSQLNVTGPLVLVGHGTGGYHMRQLAADLAPTGGNVTVAGLVLLDAMHESVTPALDRISPHVHEALASRRQNAATLLKMSHVGVVRLVHTVQAKRNAERFSATSLPYVDYFTPSPPHRRGIVHENEGVDVIETNLTTSPLPRLSVPVVVLSHGNHTMFMSMKMEPGITNDVVEQMETQWAAGQAALAELSATSVHRILRDAGHDIAHDKPDVVAKAILAVLHESRGDADAGLRSLDDTV
ncbi:hypothetical protein H257_10941 [Aphanomyces astaci]|uniref:AB hydrolase-1 domain-containing protein n=1 Tax=Aphanomyces astaci TaxID=112090 RepID=W4G3T2_APHAT|nr:hypothetical protein H257_10941 [Aphanomyces astaci]ETV74350.1 hypothetical protein H257_10941 [Aphanomyces astaci]|eukprot:XP_009836008.1 hypothetical protein H257_10941 [Aphanomyces astaci]